MSIESGKLMKHIIDQATFDETVKENVEVLDMDSSEAVNEAKTQYISQNVDLSNIITDAYLHNGIENHPFVKSFNKCKELFKQEVLKSDETIGTLQGLIKEMETDKAKKLYVGNNGGYSLAMDFLRDLQTKAKASQTQEDDFVFVQGLELCIVLFLRKVLDGYPDLLDAKDVPLILSILEKYVTDKSGYTSNMLICHLLDLISATLVLHENNRELWSSSPLLLDLLSTIPSRGDHTTLQRTLKLLRAMTLDDDIRVEVANTHERVRKFADRFLPDLTQMLEKEQSLQSVDVSPEKRCETMSLLLKTLASLVVRNEHCAIVVDNGGVSAVMNMTRQLLSPALEGSSISPQDIELVIALMGFVKTIVGNDDVKNTVAESGLVEIIVAFVNVVRDRNNSDRLDCVPLYEPYLLLLATLTLRHAEISSKLLEHSILEILVSIMKEHPSNVKTMMYGSWIIRNVCSRHKQSVETLLSIGGDEVLQAGLKTHPSIGYDIKNALKQFGDAVDVKLEEQWTGKGQLNFNPEF